MRQDGAEIEITPEMIEAGVEAFSLFDGGYMETHEDAAERIYGEMCRAREAAQVPTRRSQGDIP